MPKLRFEVHFDFDSDLLLETTSNELCKYIRECIATGKESKNVGDPIMLGLFSESVRVSQREFKI